MASHRSKNNIVLHTNMHIECIVTPQRRVDDSCADVKQKQITWWIAQVNSNYLFYIWGKLSDDRTTKGFPVVFHVSVDRKTISSKQTICCNHSKDIIWFIKTDNHGQFLDSLWHSPTTVLGCGLKYLLYRKSANNKRFACRPMTADISLM